MLCIGSGDEGSDQEREWEEQQIKKGVSGIQQVITEFSHCNTSDYNDNLDVTLSCRDSL